MKAALLFLTLLAAFGIHAQLSGGTDAKKSSVVHVFGGRSLPKVVVRTNDLLIDQGDSYETHSTTPSQVPGAVIDFTTARGKRSFLLMRFSASSWCQGPANQHCSVVIRVNGQEAHPRAGGNARFDSGSTENQESNSIERVLGPYRGGRSLHVQVMAATSSTNLSFRVFEWAMVVEQIRML